MHPHLAAANLFYDKDIEQAKKLILNAIKKHQARKISIRPPFPEFSHSYAKAIAQLSKQRGSDLWHPYLGSGFGCGPLVELADGSVKYDFISGIGTYFFGHSQLEIIETNLQAALSDIVIQGNLQQNIEVAELTSLLIEVSRLPHCMLTTSGSMAMENGLKIAFQKKFPANRLLAFENCFSGRTLVLSQISDKPLLRELLPPTISVDYIPFYDATRPQESTKLAVIALQQALARYPKQHAAMLFELVQGEGGCYAGNREFFLALIDVLKKHQVAVFIDEIQTFGRTSELFAYQYFELEEYVDICTIGKLSLVCATLFRNDFVPQPGLLGQTFISSTAAIQTAIKVIHMLLEQNLYGKEGKIASLHAYFESKFNDLSRRHPSWIKGPFGLGGLIAFTPFEGDKNKVFKFLHMLFEAGVMAFYAGAHPTRVRFLPPMAAIGMEDIDIVMGLVEDTLERCAYVHR